MKFQSYAGTAGTITATEMVDVRGALLLLAARAKLNAEEMCDRAEKAIQGPDAQSQRREILLLSIQATGYATLAEYFKREMERMEHIEGLLCEGCRTGGPCTGEKVDAAKSEVLS